MFRGHKKLSLYSATIFVHSRFGVGLEAIDSFCLYFVHSPKIFTLLPNTFQNIDFQLQIQRESPSKNEIDSLSSAIASSSRCFSSFDNIPGREHIFFLFSISIFNKQIHSFNGDE